MSFLSRDTALIIFARTAGSEAQEKAFTQDARQNIALVQLLNGRSLLLAAQSGLPYFHIDESIQKGKNFAERLNNAFKAVFEKGFSKIIAIGNDCLELTPKEIFLANYQLDHSNAVLGPNQRNGIYLIGLTKQSFEAGTLENIRWQTSHTLEDLMEEWPESYLLLVKSDINTLRDLQCCVKLEISAGLKILLKQLLGLVRALIALADFRFVKINERLYFALRAPPLNHWAL